MLATTKHPYTVHATRTHNTGSKHTGHLSDTFFIHRQQHQHQSSQSMVWSARVNVCSCPWTRPILCVSAAPSLAVVQRLLGPSRVVAMVARGARENHAAAVSREGWWAESPAVLWGVLGRLGFVMLILTLWTRNNFGEVQ